MLWVAVPARRLGYLAAARWSRAGSGWPAGAGGRRDRRRPGRDRGRSQVRSAPARSASAADRRGSRIAALASCRRCRAGLDRQHAEPTRSGPALGTGSGSGTGPQIDPFAACAANCSQGATVELMKVSTDLAPALTTCAPPPSTATRRPGWRLGPGDRRLGPASAPNLPLPDPVASLRDVGQSRRVTAPTSRSTALQRRLPARLLAPTSVSGARRRLALRERQRGHPSTTTGARPGLPTRSTQRSNPGRARPPGAGPALPPDSPTRCRGCDTAVRPEVGRHRRGDRRRDARRTARRSRSTSTSPTGRTASSTTCRRSCIRPAISCCDFLTTSRASASSTRRRWR